MYCSHFTWSLEPMLEGLPRLLNRLASYFVAIVLISSHLWSEMYAFDVLTMLELLVSNIYKYAG